MERLQKVIANSGYCSRRKAETLISVGLVTVDGKIVKEMGIKVGAKNEIMVEGNYIKSVQTVYYLLYKPTGYVSTTNDEHERRTVLDLIDTDKRVYPVGRLDYDTSGVLIITNDGELTSKLINPKSQVEKEYRVKMKGFLRREESLKLSRGVYINGRKTKRAIIKDVEYIKVSESTEATIILTEGKNHQVRNMFAEVGHEVTKLKRVRFGNLTVDKMKTGESRLMKPYELKQLRTLIHEK